MFEASELILIAVSMLLAAGFQAFTGFGFSLICTAVLAMILDDVQTAVLLLVLPGWFAGGSAAFSLRRVAPWKSIRTYLLVTPVGILVGVWILDVVPAWALELLLIVLLLQVLLSSAIGGLGSWIQHTIPSGFLAGLAAGSLGTAGPPVVAWAQNKETWELPQRRAATLWVFALITPMRLPFYIAFGLMTNPHIWTVALGSIPFVFVGSLLGNRIALHVSKERSEAIVKLAMAALAVALGIQAYGHITG